MYGFTHGIRLLSRKRTLASGMKLRYHLWRLREYTMNRSFLLSSYVALLLLGIAACGAPKTTATSNATTPAEDKTTVPRYNTLNSEEQRVILHKGTERPGTGKFLHHKADGFYTCRQCGAGLYRSHDKFESGCGWPSFDDEIIGAVTHETDADGQRTEILCARCQGHLGHVFQGEGMTPKNTRHCVNSVSLDFVPAERVGRAIFAGGCFWGVEYHFQGVKGVLSVTSGYIGGKGENPAYKDVCSGSTGHAEAVEILYDTEIANFADLAKLFFEIHDPTQEDGQGPDLGEQYRSAVFFTTPEQKQVAEQLIATLKSRGLPVVTVVTPASTFYPAEDYHQNYYRSHHKQPYCHKYVKRF